MELVYKRETRCPNVDMLFTETPFSGRVDKLVYKLEMNTRLFGTYIVARIALPQCQVREKILTTNPQQCINA